MLNNNPTLSSPFGSYRSARSSSTQLKQANITRNTRQRARADRRWGNWDDYLLIPAALLWLESAPAMCFGDECVAAPPAVIDLWL